MLLHEPSNPVCRDFPGGPVVKNPPCNAGDEGLIPGGGTKIPRALERPSLCTTENPCAAMKNPAWCKEDSSCCDPVQPKKKIKKKNPVCSYTHTPAPTYTGCKHRHTHKLWLHCIFHFVACFICICVVKSLWYPVEALLESGLVIFAS